MRVRFFKERFDELVVLTDSTTVKVWTLLLLAFLIVYPLIAGSFLTAHLTMILLTLVGALGLNILTGYTGQISLGHVAFMMLGAYGYAVSVDRYQLHPLLALLMAGCVPAVGGLVVGIPSLRLKGLYLAITTLAFAFIVSAVVLAAEPLTAGSRGIFVARPVILGFSLESDRNFYWFCLVVAVLTMIACLNLRRSRTGRAFVALRDNDIAARAMGINLLWYKLLAFIISSFLAGIAGALLALYLTFVNVEGFPFLLSIEALAILVVGGVGSVLGTVFGTVFLLSLPEVVSLVFEWIGSGFADSLSSSAHEIKGLLYGLVIIGFLRFDPRGLLGIWLDVRRLWSNWPLRY